MRAGGCNLYGRSGSHGIPLLQLTTPIGILGDVNLDGEVNISDITFLIDVILGKQKDYVFDSAGINQDGSVDISDLTTLITYLLNGSWN